MTFRLIVGLAMTAVALWLAGRRLLMLYRLGRTAQPVEPGRTDGVGARLRAELVEVLGQRKLLKWTVPGIAHVLAFWGFILLMLTLIEGYGALFLRDFAIPVIGRSAAVGLVGSVKLPGVALAPRPGAVLMPSWVSAEPSVSSGRAERGSTSRCWMSKAA